MTAKVFQLIQNYDDPIKARIDSIQDHIQDLIHASEETDMNLENCMTKLNEFLTHYQLYIED